MKTFCDKCNYVTETINASVPICEKCKDIKSEQSCVNCNKIKMRSTSGSWVRCAKCSLESKLK